MRKTQRGNTAAVRKETVLQRDGRRIRLEILRSARKSIGLEVKSSTEAVMRIPARLSDAMLQGYIEKYTDWIFEKTEQTRLGQQRMKSIGAPSAAELSQAEIGRIREKIASRVYHYCRIMDVSVGRITIRNQKTRWGSCSGKGNVNFNYLLYYLPEDLLDYVVVHELAHRRYMDHSANFWAEVEKYCPAYRQCRARLKEYRIPGEALQNCDGRGTGLG